MLQVLDSRHFPAWLCSFVCLVALWALSGKEKGMDRFWGLGVWSAVKLPRECVSQMLPSFPVERLSHERYRKNGQEALLATGTKILTGVAICISAQLENVVCCGNTASSLVRNACLCWRAQKDILRTKSPYRAANPSGASPAQFWSSWTLIVSVWLGPVLMAVTVTFLFGDLAFFHLVGVSDWALSQRIILWQWVGEISLCCDIKHIQAKVWRIEMTRCRGVVSYFRSNVHT